MSHVLESLCVYVWCMTCEHAQGSFLHPSQEIWKSYMSKPYLAHWEKSEMKKWMSHGNIPKNKSKSTHQKKGPSTTSYYYGPTMLYLVIYKPQFDITLT